MASLPSAGSDNTVGILIKTTADDSGIDKAKTDLEGFGGSLKSVGDKMTGIGRSLSEFVTVPVVGLGTAAVLSATKFQQSMTYIRTDAGDTTDNIQKLSNAILDLAQHSQFSADTLANGLYHIASLGLRGADAMKALNTAQQMASVGGADLESTATALGGAIVSGIKGVEDYNTAAGVLDATIGAGNMRMQDLVSAIGTGVLPVFKNAGISINDFGAALADLTDNGQDAAAAATHLRMTVSLMEAPSQKAAGALAAIGLAQDQLAKDMQSKGLLPALGDLKKHLIDTYGTTAEGKVKIAQTLTEAFGGGRSSAAIQTLVDQLDRVVSKYKQIGEQGDEFSKKVLEQQSTPAAQFKMATNAMNADLIKLGATILPIAVRAVHDLAEGISKLTNWFERLSPTQQKFALTIAAIAAAAGPILMVVGGIATSIAAIAVLGAPFLLVIGAIAGLAILGALIIANWGKVKEWFNDFTDWLKGIFIATVDHISDAWKKVGDVFHDVGDALHMIFNLFAGDDPTLKAAHAGSAAWQTFAKALAKVHDIFKIIGDAVHQFRTHTLEDIGFVEGFILALPIRIIEAVIRMDIRVGEMFLHMGRKAIDGFGAFLTWLAHINWGDVFAAIWRGYIGIWERILKATRSYIDGIVHSFTSIDWLGIFMRIIKAIIDIYAESYKWFYHVGENMIKGILDGMKNNFHSVADAVRDFGNGLVKGFESGINAHIPHFASGTNYAPGGWSMVGESGPEMIYVPRGATIKTNTQSNTATTNNHQMTNNITVNLSTTQAVQEFFRKINQDSMNVGRGLSPVQGKY